MTSTVTTHAAQDSLRKAAGLVGLGRAISGWGTFAIYVALAIIYFWFGAMKFTAYEAQGIQGLVEHSPLLSWMYRVFDVRGFGYFLGVLELSVGLLIALRWLWPAASALGGLLSMGLFLTTVSFMFTTPGVFVPSLGFPAISADVGQFLLKDVGLFAGSALVLGESLVAWGRRRHGGG